MSLPAQLAPALRPVRVGVVLSLLTMLYGYGLGAAFGAGEASLKGHLAASAEAVKDTVYKGDDAKRSKVTSKAWTYFKRAHMHAGALGSAGLVLCLLVACLGVSDKLKAFSAAAPGIGGLGYSLYWMLAALRAPGMGGTHEARESLDWLAIPSSGLVIMGTLWVLVLFIREGWLQASTDAGQ